MDDKRKSGKRGRVAPGKTPFLAALSRNEKGLLIYMGGEPVGVKTSSR